MEVSHKVNNKRKRLTVLFILVVLILGAVITGGIYEKKL